jgi:hypothetical protein
MVLVVVALYEILTLRKLFIIILRSHTKDEDVCIIFLYVMCFASETAYEIIYRAVSVYKPYVSSRAENI